jgi:probable lipoprotein NlpC
MKKRRILSAMGRLLVFLCLIICLDSCRLFRKRESSTTYPTSRASYNSRTINNIIITARGYTGVPYRSGGNDAGGFDCSGLICSVYGSQGFQLPRISWQQANIGREVEIADVKPGDLVFFVTNKGGTANINHAGLITEVHSEREILFIHASSSKGVREDNLFSKYWIACFAKATRPF